MKKISLLSIFFMSMVAIVGCKKDSKTKELTVQDIEIFKNTPVWELALVVDRQRVSKIKKIIAQAPELANYKDPVYGTTLLMRSISMNKFKSAKALLESGANPNIVSTTGTNALFRAVAHSWFDRRVDKNPRFVVLLLKYGADPNVNYCAPEVALKTSPIECGTSPLIHAVSRSFEKVRVLVEGGAKVNYNTKSGMTAAIRALLMEDVDSAYYLIVKKEASVSEPFYFYTHGNDRVIQYDKPHYPIDLLHKWVYELNSKKYEKKMAIVEVFRRQGQNYFNRKEKIPQHILRKIKYLYPNTWESYLEKY